MAEHTKMQKMQKVQKLHGLFGYGLGCAFFGACLGIDDLGQFILFVFGITWGRMLDRADSPALSLVGQAPEREKSKPSD